MNIFISLHKKLPIFRKLIIRIVLYVEKGSYFSLTYRKIYKETYGIWIGEGTYGGCFNTKDIPKGTHFGNYCSIGPNLKIFRANHPLSKFTTHPILYNPKFGFVKVDQLDRPEIFIGHDVWIGADVIILPNVKNIGNGAVIGAGSVVTKDIGEFEIWAGNPARKIGERFDNITKQKIIETNWWEKSINELKANIPSLLKYFEIDGKE